MKSKHKLMKRIFENQGMKVNFDSFGKNVEEEIVQEGEWGEERHDVEWDRNADTLGGTMAWLLLNSPVGKLVKNKFEIPTYIAKTETDIWTDEVRKKVADRPADILKRYEEMLSVLKQLSAVEKENQEMRGAFRATDDWYQSTKGPHGYTRIGPMFDALHAAAEKLQKNGMEKLASMTKQAAERIGTLQDALRNSLGDAAAR